MQYIHNILHKTFMELKTKSRNLPHSEKCDFFFNGQRISVHELFDY